MKRLLMLHFLFTDQGSGFCVTGKIEAGYIQTGDRILAMPPNETCTVKGKRWCVFAAGLALCPTEHFLLIDGTKKRHRDSPIIK